MRRVAGFTLIELLVVVAVIALLIAILIPSLGRARETSRRTICGTRLRAQGQAVSIYAAQNRDQLPVFPVPPGVVSTPHWWWDVSVDFADALLMTARQGGSGTYSAESARRIFYCPSFEEQNTRMADDIWKHFNYRVFGYAWLHDRGNGPDRIPGTSDDQAGALTANSRAFFTNPPATTRSPPLRLVRQWGGTSRASETELAFDAILSPDSSGSRWDQIQGGYTVEGFRHRTNHMERSRPAGGNFLYCDGHVEWLKFPNQLSRAIPIPTSSGPYFWVWK